jgi:hypothetical protein
VSYRLPARLEVDEGKLERARRGLGRFLLATDVLDREALPAGEVLGRRVERGFRFLKDPLFFTGSTFLKRAERVMALGMVMALALLVYALGEWALRRGLAETGSSLPDQKSRPTRRPTLRWVFGLFLWVRLVELEGRPLVLNLAPPSRDRGAPAGGTAILPPGVRGVRNVGMRRRTKVLQAKDDGSDISLIPAFSNQ